MVSYLCANSSKIDRIEGKSVTIRTEKTIKMQILYGQQPHGRRDCGRGRRGCRGAEISGNPIQNVKNPRSITPGIFRGQRKEPFLQVNFPVLLFKFLHCVPDENDHLTVGGAALVGRQDMQLVQKRLIYTNGKPFFAVSAHVSTPNSTKYGYIFYSFYNQSVLLWVKRL